MCHSYIEVINVLILILFSKVSLTSAWQTHKAFKKVHLMLFRASLLLVYPFRIFRFKFKYIKGSLFLFQIFKLDKEGF